MFTLSNVISWLIVGALTGSVLGGIFKKAGHGKWTWLGIGLVGAVIGGVIFGLLKIDFGLGEIKVTLEAVVSAFLGALVFLLILWIVQKSKAKKAPKA